MSVVDPKQTKNLVPCCKACEQPVSLGQGVCLICGNTTEVVLLERKP